MVYVQIEVGMAENIFGSRGRVGVIGKSNNWHKDIVAAETIVSHCIAQQQRGEIIMQHPFPQSHSRPT